MIVITTRGEDRAYAAGRASGVARRGVEREEAAAAAAMRLARGFDARSGAPLNARQPGVPLDSVVQGRAARWVRSIEKDFLRKYSELSERDSIVQRKVDIGIFFLSHD